MATDATTTALNSQGSAMREQEEYNKSLEARINRLTTSWYSFANAVGENGLYDTIVVATKALEIMTNVGESGLNIFNIYSATLGALGVGLTLLSTRFAGVAGAIGTLVKAKITNNALTTQSTAIQGRYSMAVASTDVAVRKLTISKSAYQAKLASTTATTTAATAATATLSATMKSLALATGVGAVFVVAGFALEKLISRMSEASQESENLDAQLKKNTDALTVNSDEVIELMNQYNQLTQAKLANDGWDSTNEQEYLSVQQRLAEMFPALVDHIDSTGQAHIKNSSEIEKEIELTNNLIEAKKEQVRVDAESTIKDKLKENNKIRDDIEKTKDFIEDTQKKIANNSWTIDTKEAISNVATLQVKVQEFEIELHNSTAEMVTEVLNIADAFATIKIDNAIKNEVEAFIRTLDFSNMNADQLKKFAIELSRIVSEIQKAFSSGDASGISNFVDELNNLASDTEGFNADINGLELTLDKLNKSAGNTGKGVGTVTEDLTGLGETAEDTAKRIEKLEESISNLKSTEEKLVGTSYDAVDASKELVFMYEQLTNRMQGYNDKELEALLIKPRLTNEEQQVVTAMKQRDQVLQELMVLYPEYAKLQEGAISLSSKQVEAMKQEEKANKVLLEAYKLMSEGKLNSMQIASVNQASATKSTIANIKAEIAALNLLIKQYENVANASLTSQQFIDKIQSGDYQAHSSSFVLPNPTEQVKNQISNLNLDLSTYGSTLDGLISSIDTFSAKINDTTKKSTSAKKESSKAAKESNKTTKDSIYITDKYKQAMEALNLAIEKQQALQNKFPSHSESYRKAMEAEIKLQEQQLKLQKEQATALEKQIKNRKINQTGNVTVGETTTTKAKVSGFDGRLTSKQGYRTHPVTGKRTYHAGIDLASPLGTRLDSNVNGKVIKQDYNSISGNYVQIQDSNGVKHFFGHLQKALVKVGDIVKTGQQIGKIGSTGRSTGSHLHYEVKDKNGKQLDAMSYAKEAMSGLVVSSKTVKDTVSTTQESVDNTQSTLNGIYSSIEKDEEKLANLRQRNASWTIDEYNANRRKILDEELAHEEAKLTNLEIGSERYNKTLENQTNLLKRKQKVNKDDLKFVEDQIKSGKLSAIQLDEYKNRAVALKTEAHELDQVLQNSVLRKYDLFDNLREAPTNEIEVLRAKMELLDDDTLGYSKSLDDVIVGLREIQDINQKELVDLEKDIKSGNYTGQALEDLKDRYDELKLTILNTNSEIRNTFYESSKVKFNINNKSIKKTQDEIDFLNYKLSMLDETDITTKVSVMFDIQNNLTTSISKMDSAIKDAIIMRNDAIAMGLSTDVYDGEIEGLISQRRGQLTEMQNTFNQMQSIVTDAKNKIKEAEDNAYSEASKDIDRTIKQTEKSLKYFSDIIENFNNEMELLQESDYDEKIGITTNQVAQNKQLANQIVAEYHRIASTPVYNEEQKDKVESQLESLKSQLASVNSETLNYAKNLEKIKFNKLLSGTNKSQKELNRLLDALQGNIDILEGGRLSGTDINLDFGLPEGNVLDLSTLIENPASSLQAQELQIQDIRSSSYGGQIAEAESFYNEMKAQAEKFQSVMMDAVEKFERMVTRLTEIADKEKQKEKDKANEELLKSTQKLSKDELETLQKHYKNIKENMLDSMGEYKDDFGGIWDDIIADLDSKLKIIENSLSNIGSGTDIATPPTSTTPSTGSNNNSGNSGSKPTSPTTPSKPKVDHTNDGNLTTADYASNHKVEFIKKSTKDKDTAYITFTKASGKSPVSVNYVKNPSGLRTYFNNDEAYQIFINSHAEGTDGSSGGLSLVGEEGSELVVQKDGTAYLTGNSHELRNLQQGDKVFTADETKKMLTDKKNSIPAFANGTNNIGYYPSNTVQMVDFKGNTHFVEFNKIMQEFNNGLRFLVDGVASTTISLIDHGTGFETKLDGFKNDIGYLLTSGRYEVQSSEKRIGTEDAKEVINLVDSISTIVNTKHSRENKDYLDLEHESSIKLMDKLDEWNIFAYGSKLENREQELMKYIDYHTGKTNIKPEYYSNEIMSLLNDIYLTTNESKKSDLYKEELGKALEQVVSKGDTSLVDEFKKKYPNLDTVISNMSSDQIKSEYSGDYSKLSELISNGEVYNDGLLSQYSLINDSLAEMKKLSYEYYNTMNNDTLSQFVKDNTLSGIQQSFNSAFSNIKALLGNDDKLGISDVMKLFGNKASDDIYQVGITIANELATTIKQLTAPKNADDVLVYDGNNNPNAWYSKDVAHSIVNAMWSEGWRIGSENASQFMKPKDGNQSDPSNPNGSNSPSPNFMDGINTKIPPSESFVKFEEEYLANRSSRVKKIADLQAQLDEAELSNNKVEEDRLTKLILDETNKLNRDDYKYAYTESIDLIKQTKIVAQKAISDLKHMLDTETLTEETRAEIKEKIAEFNSIIINTDNQQKEAVSKLLESQNNYWNELNSEFTDKIDDLEYEKDMLDEDDTTNKLKLDKEIAEQQKLYIKSLNSQKKELEDLLKTQEVGTYEWNQTNIALKDVKESIEDANISLKNMGKELENTTNDIIDTIKKGLEKQRDLEVAELEKRLEKISEVYQSKLDAIGDRETERTFNNNRQDVEDEISKLQKNINRLALNDSQEAIARRLELEKQLSDKREELAELDYQRGVELERKAISDSQELQEKAIKQEIDDVKWKYDEMIANERLFSQIRKSIIEGDLIYVENLVSNMIDSFTKYHTYSAKEIGQSFQELLNLIDEVVNAYNVLSDVSNGGKPDSNGFISGSGMIVNKPISGSPLVLDVPDYRIDNKFKDGGLTSSTGLHWLDGSLAKPEIVLNSNDTKNLLEAVKSVRGISDFTNLILPKFNTPSFDFNGNGVSNTYNLDFKFDNFSGSQHDGNFVINKVMTNLKKLGR